MMANRIKMKLALIVEDHVLRAPLAMIEFRTKAKLRSIVEDHVMCVVSKSHFSNIEIFRKVLFLVYFEFNHIAL